jgi:CTP synthase (UTP-ammonia lyase)
MGLSTGEIGLIIFSVIGGVVGVISSMPISEAIKVFLAIEENTRAASIHIQNLIK